MVNGLFAYILKYSKREQILLTAFTVLSFPFYYFSLDLPKTIVNDAINGSIFPIELGLEFGGRAISLASLSQIPYLLILCVLFLALVVINGGFKYFINVYRGVLGERMLRRMRFQLIETVMRFPLSRFRRTSQGEFVSMINQETEPLGAFIGESFSLPLYQGGMMLTILVFMFMQDWKLGVAAIALYPFQGWLIPRLQKQVNKLNKERTVRIRKLAESLAETVAGMQEIHVNDNRVYFAALYSRQLGQIYFTRIQIYKKKLLIKFLNSFIGQLTPFFFFSIGGLMVIRGELSFGALIAVLAAYKDLSPPWKELLGWYQRQADFRMKYTLLMEQFDTSTIAAKSSLTLSDEWLDQAPELPLNAENVSFTHADGTKEVDGVSLTLHPGEWLSVVGTGNSGKNLLAHLFARLVNPTVGKISVGEQDIASLPDAVAGRAVGYVGHDSYLFSLSVRDNILLSLKHRPRVGDQTDEHKKQLENEQPETQHQQQMWRDEARRSGNSSIDTHAQWIDFDASGTSDSAGLSKRLYAVLRLVDLEDELVRYALARQLESSDNAKLEQQVLRARELFKQRIQSTGLIDIVESFSPDQYNENSSVAENILLGVPNSQEFSAEGLSSHPLIRTLLAEHELTATFEAASVSIAEMMVELFSGVPAGHEFFERYSFVDADDIPILKRTLAQINHPSDIVDLAESDRRLIRSLPYRLVVARHRLGIFSESELANIVAMRKSFAERLDTASRQHIDFFTPDDYNRSSTIGENILFGRVSFGRLGAAEKVYSLTKEVLQSLDLMPAIMEVGLAAPSGLGGNQLPVTKQQKLLLARALIKNPKVLIINEGLNALDEDTLSRVLTNIRESYPALSVLWTDSQARFRGCFNRIVNMESGKLGKIEQVLERELPANAADENVAVRQSDAIDEAEKFKLISKISLFGLLDDASLALLVSTSNTVKVDKGERLFNQGDLGNSVYIIVEGRASILVSNGDIVRKIKECGADDVLGEMALLADETRSASVEALTDMVLLQLKRDIFVELLHRNGELGHQILQVVARRFINTSRKLENLIKL